MSSLLTAAIVAADDPTPTPTAASSDFLGGNWLTIAMVVLLVVMVFFMWRNSRKRRADQQKLQSAMVPGVEVMTSFGLYGKLISVDELGGTAELEVSPGNVLKVHRQTLVKVVDATDAPSGDAPRSVEEAMAVAEAEQVAREAAAKQSAESSELTDDDTKPRFGERIDPKKSSDDDGKDA